MKKSDIVAEIRRTAVTNGGVPLGMARFEAATGIKQADWFGVYWARWGDAVREAGFQPNQLNGAYDTEELLQKYAEFSRELGRLPARGDLLLKRRADPGFPSKDALHRIGKKAEFIRLLAEFCQSRPTLDQVHNWCKAYLTAVAADQNRDGKPDQQVVTGYVYLLKHGSRREYKIGRTNNCLRREGEIGVELPEEVQPIHVIETDDPAGVEAYWHRRFADKRLKNEWFALSADDVRAFKRWRRIA